MVDKNMALRLVRAGRVQAIVATHRSKPGIGAVGDGMVAVARQFQAAEEAFRRALAAWEKEGGDARTAHAPLVSAYDTARAAVMKRLPHVGVNNAASGLATPADLLVAAERLEGILVDHSYQVWVGPLFTSLAAAVDVAAREWSEAVLTGSALSDAAGALRAAAAVFDAELPGFRFVVRTELGRTSPEYLSIRTRRKSDDEAYRVPSPAS